MKEAVVSVLNQPYQAIDIVLVDDGSTDGSTELCDEIAQGCDRIHVIHQVNGGVSRARNTGIEYILRASNGTDYIAFLDADDMWAKDFLTEEIASLMEYHYEFLGFQSCNCNVDCTRRSIPAELKEGTYRGGSNNVWLHSSQAYTAALYSAQLIKKYDIRFTTDLKYSEDKVFLMQSLYLAKTVVLKNKLMYYYRQNGVSAMHNRSWGITYYTQIIKGWLNLDEQMLQWKNDVRGELRQGRVLASIYVMDMIEEHYMCFGKNTELRALFQQKGELLDLLKEVPMAGNQHAANAFIQLKAHPCVFAVKCYIKGVVMKIRVAILQNSFALKYVSRFKYPIEF